MKHLKYAVGTEIFPVFSKSAQKSACHQLLSLTAGGDLFVSTVAAAACNHWLLHNGRERYIIDGMLLPEDTGSGFEGCAEQVYSLVHPSVHFTLDS